MDAQCVVLGHTIFEGRDHYSQSLSEKHSGALNCHQVFGHSSDQLAFDVVAVVHRREGLVLILIWVPQPEFVSS